MTIIILGLIILFISLFFLYILAKHDFLLIRREINLVQIFNKAVITIVSGLFFARLFFVLDHLELQYLNPLVFLHILRFGGFSLFGFFLSISFVSFFLFQDNEIRLRFLDIFSLSFYPFLLIRFCFLSLSRFSIFFLIPFLLALLSFGILLAFRFIHFKTKDGRVYLAILILVLILNFVNIFNSPHKNLFLNLSFSQLTSIVVFLVALFILTILNRRIRTG